MPSPEFSIILPFYRQSDHMHAVIKDFDNALREFGHSYELIIVSNGISDQKDEREERVYGNAQNARQVLLKRSGWGLAVLAGLKIARGTYVVYTNSARTESRELVRMMRYALVSNDAIVKATRIERETFMRKWTSIIYNLLSRFILDVPIWDVNATPKIIPRAVLEKIHLRSEGDPIDAELVYKALQLNVPIVEVPIKQIVRKSGKSTTNIMSALKMFWGIVEIKRGKI